jgi:hypothetical protein
MVGIGKILLDETTKTKHMKSTIRLFILLGLVWMSPEAFAFCGFYVAKADATLFNNKSEVILVRNGNYTVITMGSDFQGDVKDFAMVVPVPVVLKQSDIAVVDRGLFERLDAYSAPRLAEYYDENECAIREIEKEEVMAYPSRAEDLKSSVLDNDANYSVTIEAQYTVGEYDILILSATESEGLKRWLVDNGYKIPGRAEKILQPYIKSNMEFFVVKVNLQEMKKSGYNDLRPIQIRFDHPKFMLPLRLGMANSRGTQDMIVYGFSPNGRIECTNYRTVKLPTDRNIPLFVQQDFGGFYKRLFEKSYEREGKNCVFLEYAWNVTPTWGGMKCDPCVGPPPMNQDFAWAGVNWYQTGNGNNIFFTRLHVRYDLAHFPMDLQFQTTPNQEHFQARYVIRHPAPVYDGFNCEWGQEYLVSLHDRRRMEVEEWASLTGWQGDHHHDYISQYDSYLHQLPVHWRNEIQQQNELPIEHKRGSIWPESVLVSGEWRELFGWQKILPLMGLFSFLISFIIWTLRSTK